MSDIEIDDLAAFYANMEVPESEAIGWSLVLPASKILDREGELLPEIKEWTRDNLQEKLLVIPIGSPNRLGFDGERSAPVQLHFRTEQDYVFFKMWWE